MYVQPIGRWIIGRVFNSLLFVATAITIYVIREKLDERKQLKQKMDGSILPPGAVQREDKHYFRRKEDSIR